jgi:hypothetical protein
MRLGQSETVPGGDRGSYAERHRKRSDPPNIFTAARHGDDHGSCSGKVWTLLIDAKTGVDGLPATRATNLPMARFRPATASARMRGQTFILYCSGLDRDRFRSWKRAAMPSAPARRRSNRRLECSFDGSAKSRRGPLAIIYAAERTRASKFATKFDESFQVDPSGPHRRVASGAEIVRVRPRGSAPAPTISA